MANVRYSTGYNFGSGIGTVVGGAPDVGTKEDEPARAVLGPDTEAGQALMVLGIAAGLLWIAVGPGEGGPVVRGSRVLQSVALVGAAMVLVNFTARTYVLRHPDGPLAAGLMHDL